MDTLTAEEQQVIRELQELGISPAKSSGNLEVKTGSYTLHDYQVENVSPERVQATLQLLPLPPPPPLPCIFGFEPWCWVKKAVKPIIRFKSNAFVVKDVNVKLLRKTIQGRVDVFFFNDSLPGIVWEENVKTGQRRNLRKVYPLLNSLFSSNLKAVEVGQKLANIAGNFTFVPPKVTKTTGASFITRYSTLGMIKAILQLLLRGTVRVEEVSLHKVSYRWMDRIRTFTARLRINATLPVRGKVRWSWR